MPSDPITVTVPLSRGLYEAVLGVIGANVEELAGAVERARGLPQERGTKYVHATTANMLAVLRIAHALTIPTTDDVVRLEDSPEQLALFADVLRKATMPALLERPAEARFRDVMAVVAVIEARIADLL